MPRPKCCRRIAGEPARRVFKPAGVPMTYLEEVVLSMDEFEAIRLADLLGLYQEQAAERMGISRQTFGRVVQGARSKIARVLVEGLALRIDGGEAQMAGVRVFRCRRCFYTWKIPSDAEIPAGCPACSSGNIGDKGSTDVQDAGE